MVKYGWSTHHNNRCDTDQHVTTDIRKTCDYQISLWQGRKMCNNENEHIQATGLLLAMKWLVWNLA